MDFLSIIFRAMNIGKAKVCPPFPDSIKWTLTNRYAATPATVKWLKQVIADTGFSQVFKTAGVEEIEFLEKMPGWMTVPNAMATTYGSKLLALDTGWMPGWMLPGTLIHEAVHVWQQKNDLWHYPERYEATAWMVQQVFEWRYCQQNGKTPRNLFKDPLLGAFGLL